MIKQEAHEPQWPTWVNSYQSSIQHWQKIKMRNVHTLFLFGVDHSTNISINVLSHYSQFSFFTVQVYENLSCHSNQSTEVTAIKNKTFVKVNPMNISAKVQLYPPYSFWGVDFLIFFRKFCISVAKQSNWKVWTKIISLVEDHSTSISDRLFTKYLYWGSNKCDISFFSPLYI